VIDGRNKYKGLSLDVPNVAKGDRLVDDVWKVDPKKETIECNSVCSTSAATTWFSPGAPNRCLPWADLPMIHDISAKYHEDWSLLGCAWQGGLLTAQHKLIFRLVGDHTTPWYIGLDHYDDSSVNVWPVALGDVPGVPLKIATPKEKITSPEFVPVFDLKQVEAYKFVFKSYMDLCTRRVANVKILPKRLFIECVDGPSNPVILAYRSGWWAVSRNLIIKYTLAYGVRIECKGNLFPVMMEGTMKCLEIPDGGVAIRSATDSVRQEFHDRQ